MRPTVRETKCENDRAASSANHEKVYQKSDKVMEGGTSSAMEDVRHAFSDTLHAIFYNNTHSHSVALESTKMLARWGIGLNRLRKAFLLCRHTKVREAGRAGGSSAWRSSKQEEPICVDKVKMHLISQSNTTVL